MVDDEERTRSRLETTVLVSGWGGVTPSLGENDQRRPPLWPLLVIVVIAVAIAIKTMTAS